MSQSDVPPPKRHWTAAAVVVFVLGLLFLVPSGLCTAAMGVLGLFAMFESPSEAAGGLLTLVYSLMVGLPFLGIGAGLVWLALRLRRKE